MEAERIIKEKEIVHDSEHKDYASKGVGISISTKATDYQWLLFLRHYFGDLVVVC